MIKASLLCVAALALTGCETIAIGPDVGHVSSISQHFTCGFNSDKCWGFEEAGLTLKMAEGPFEVRATDSIVLDPANGHHTEIFEAHATFWVQLKGN